MGVNRSAHLDATILGALDETLVDVRADHARFAEKVVASEGRRMISAALRVVMITNTPAPYRRPLMDELSLIERFRFEFWFMAQREKLRKWNLLSNDENTRFFRDCGFDLSGSEGPVIHLNPGILIQLLRTKPDVVILAGYDSATTLLASFLMKIQEVPFLFWIESTMAEETPIRRFLKPVIGKIVSLASGVIVPGVAAREYVTSLGVATGNISVAHNSVDPEAFSASNAARLRGRWIERFLLAGGPVCLYVGRLTKKKGVLDLVRAFKLVTPKHPNSRLVIVGDGPLRGELEDLISENADLQGRIILAGNQPYQVLPQAYAAADLFIFPTYRDVWGMVVNEAMSTSVCTIASSRAGATRDLVSHEVTGMIFEPGDVDSLCSCISRLMEDSDLRRRIAWEAHKRVAAAFTPKVQAESLAQAIDAVVHPRAEIAHQPNTFKCSHYQNSRE